MYKNDDKKLHEVALKMTRRNWKIAERTILFARWLSLWILYEWVLGVVYCLYKMTSSVSQDVDVKAYVIWLRYGEPFIWTLLIGSLFLSASLSVLVVCLIYKYQVEIVGSILLYLVCGITTFAILIGYFFIFDHYGFLVYFCIWIGVISFAMICLIQFIIYYRYLFEKFRTLL